MNLISLLTILTKQVLRVDGPDLVGIGMGQKNPAVETAGCKPKPTAYEKYLLVRTIYLIVISFAASLTSAFLGRFNFNTPLT